MALVVIIAGIVFAVPNLLRVNVRRESSRQISLLQPAMAQEGGLSFLEQEAGIAAYINAEKQVDMAKVKTVYRTVEKETADYIVGSVGLKNYPVSDDVHVFVHRDGWIVAYYGKEEPTSKIMDWVGYSPGRAGTKLHLALANMAGTVGAGLTGMKYYHYAYPAANKLMIIADSDSFKITIPHEISVYDVSGSTGKVGSGSEAEYRNIGVTQLTPDAAHTVESVRYDVQSGRYGMYIDGNRSMYTGSRGSCALVIVFQEL